VVRSKSIAFIRFVFRASCEFAKEAMGNQSLQPAWWPGQGGKDAVPEVLNIRWAYDDPNPTAIRRVKREHDEAFVDGAAREEARLAPEQRAALAQQRALEAGVAGAPPSTAALPYPSTDAQYGGGAAAPQDAAYAAWAAAAAAAGYRPEDVAAYYAAAAAQHAGQPGQQGQQGQAQGAGVVLAGDSYEYDADDPYYQFSEGEEDAAPQQGGATGEAAGEPAAASGAAAPAAAPAQPAARAPAPAPAPAAAPEPPAAAAAPLALLAAYGSDSEDA
jgi:hypothetical protein